MSISTQTCKQIYVADGETRQWEIPFPFLSADDIAVYVTDLVGNETLVSSGYEVSAITGEVTYPTLASGLAPVVAGYHVTVLRVTPLTQQITLTQQGVLDAAELEHGYDKLTLQLQEIKEQTSRCIQYKVSSGKTSADADEMLADLQTQQQQALESMEQTKQLLQQEWENETTLRAQADLSLQQNIQTLTNLQVQNDATQTLALQAETNARTAADTALQEAIDRLNFITFVTALPVTGNAKYIYAVPQEETDLEDHPIVVLYVWNTSTEQWNAVGAFSTNLDPVSLLTKTEAADTYLGKTEAANTYVTSSQKAVAGGIATLDETGKVTQSQLPCASANVLGGIKQSFDSTTGTWTVTTESI